MSREPAQLSLSFRIFRSIAIGAAIFGFAFLLFMGGSLNLQKDALRDGYYLFVSFFFIFLPFIILIHFWIVIRSRWLTSHTISDHIVPIFLIPLAILFIVNLVVVVWNACTGLNTTSFFASLSTLGILLVAILILGLRMKPILAFSIPSNWLSVIPLVLSYLMFFNPYVWLAGMTFPTHRRMKELWRPKPLPRLKHRSIPAREVKP